MDTPLGSVSSAQWDSRDGGGGRELGTTRLAPLETWRSLTRSRVTERQGEFLEGRICKNEAPPDVVHKLTDASDMLFKGSRLGSFLRDNPIN